MNKFKEILERIFNYYKKEYNLNTVLVIEPYLNDCFHRSFSNMIVLGLLYVKDENIKFSCPKFLKYSVQKRIILCLLHEIKHVIDWKNNKEQFIKEKEETDFSAYGTDINYHNSRPFEQRAEEFAFAEVNKWGIYIKEKVLQCQNKNT
jgi:hypothetical protein